MLTEEKGLNFTGGFSTLSQFLQKQRKDRHTEEVEAEKASPMRSASILASRPEKTASAILQAEARAKS